MKYFESRALSEKLSINLAKWKRWTREFLPPDPLGGLQSGYARQYTPGEAFIVFLGGCAVSELNIPIPETKKLLKDFNAWLMKNDILSGPDGGTGNPVLEHIILFSRDTSGNRILYHLRHVISCRSIEIKGNKITETRYFDEAIQTEPPETGGHPAICTRSLHLTRIYKEFMDKLGLSMGPRLDQTIDFR